MRERFQAFLSSLGTDLSHRLFILSGIGGSIAVFAMAVITIFAQQGFIATASLLVMFVIMVIATVLVYKHPAWKEVCGAVVVVFGIFVIFPLGYLTGGGAHSGTPVWFAIISIFIASIFNGRSAWIYWGLAAIMLVVLTYISYLHPELVVPLSSNEFIYVDTAFAAVVVGFLVAVFLRYQKSVYEHENQITQEQKEEIEALSEAQNTFFSSISHEIRTPLNTIIGLNEMTLRDQNVSEEVAENAANIQNASRMLLSLINDVLDLSKIESSRMELSEAQYETSRMLSDIVNLLWGRAKDKNLRFEVHVGDAIPSMLYGDEMRLKQVIVNVLTNAIKYTNEGTVSLSVDGEATGPDEFLLRVDVDDTGIGIRKEAIPYLFDSFKRVDTERNRNVEGTGLGLAISKQLIDLMGGSITVDSIYTKGSNFHIEVTQRIANADPMRYSSIAEAPRDASYNNIFEAPEAHVLIVDDNDMNRMVSRKLLRGTRVQADVAASGQECLDKTAKVHYDVIFMDHEMPEMDGIETLKRVRNQHNGLCRNTPIIALTANAGSDMNSFYINNGFSAYLAKPIHGSLLEATLLQFLPAELIERSVSPAAEGEVLKVSSVQRKKRFAITVDCPCDLPEDMLSANGILQMPYYIITNQGRFRDISEIDSDNLFAYLNTGGHAQSSPGTVEEYETFFGDALLGAEVVLHLSVSSDISLGYDIACQAANSFDNVHVIDTKQFSSGLGLVALQAARLVDEGGSLQEIIACLQAYSRQVMTTMLVPELNSPILQKTLPAALRGVLKALSLEPVLRVSPRGVHMVGVHGGYVTAATVKFIKTTLFRARTANKRLLVVTYSGASLAEQEEFMNQVKKDSNFSECILQKASATVSASTWTHCFVLTYAKE